MYLIYPFVPFWNTTVCQASLVKMPIHGDNIHMVTTGEPNLPYRDTNRFFTVPRVRQKSTVTGSVT